MSEVLAQDLAWASAGELAAALAAGRASAVELAEAAIARIEARDGPLNAVVVRDFDRARQAAREADVALARGARAPLLGVPMTVKEAHNVAGLPTTWGFSEAAGWIAPADSIGVARLKAAGAVILGKTNVPVSLADWQSVNPVYGRTNNPWALERTSGGSSGGSAAALAAGMVPLEFGSDIGGSIRVPAAFCGVYGHKPSYGVVPGRGHSPPGIDGLDVPLGVIGPMARTAADLDLALSVLAGPAEEEAAGYRLDLPAPRRARLADHRILVLDNHPLAVVSAEVRDALNDLAGRLERLGTQVARRSTLLPDLARSHEVYMGLLTAIMSRGGPAPPDLISAHGWMDLLDAQLAIRRQWAALFEAFDLVLAPAYGTVAFRHLEEPDPAKRLHRINGEDTPYFGQLAWPGMATLANLPATAAPVGLDREGLPIGIQIIGPYLHDRATIAFARLLEQEFGGFRPPSGY
ncbi:MAG: amidase family protein [Phenylobacterium sp.]|uniref:amidase family protein n=1 Tax=Phenylobacterium sp. TaxID=1871053 RepID=UPI00391B4F43